MENRQRLIAMLGFIPDENGVAATLEEVGVQPLQTYDAANYPKIRLAAIKLMEVLLSTPNTSNNITGFSVTYDRGAIQTRLQLLKEEAGLVVAIAKGSLIRSLNGW